MEHLDAPSIVLHRLESRSIKTVGQLAAYGFARLAAERGIGPQGVAALYQQVLRLDGVSQYLPAPPVMEQSIKHVKREESSERIEGVLYSPSLSTLCINGETLEHMLLREFIISALVQHPLGLTSEQLETLPVSYDVIMRLGDFVPVLADLVDEGEITLEGGVYQRKLPSFEEVVTRSFPSKRTAQIILMRAESHTLKEVGHAFDISRERVHQLASKDVVEPLLLRSREGRLANIYAHYDVTFEELSATFNADRSEWDMLKVFVHRHKQLLPFREILTDFSIPLAYRRRAQKTRTRDFIEIDGALIRLKRNEICRYLLKTYASEHELGEDEVLCLYNAFIEENGLAGRKDLELSPSYLRGTLHRINNVLTVQGRKLRYYDFEEHDVSSLLSQLNLHGLWDREFSARVFFIRQPKLMEEFGLLNEHELHNVIRRYIEDNPQGPLPIKVARRSPILYRGSPKGRDAQVLELARILSPISTKNLAHEYEKRYGVDPASFIANYTKCLEPFTSRGTVNLNVSLPPDSQLEQLGSMLTKNWYSLDQLEGIFASVCLGDNSALNSATLWTLGYTLYSDCAIRSSWDNLYSYYSSFFERPLVLKESLPEEIASSRSFVAYLWHQQKDLELLEYDEDTWITRKGLDALEIPLLDLRCFHDDVLSWCASNNEPYVTASFVRVQCPGLPLFSYDFADEFYSSVLCSFAKTGTSFSVRGTKVLALGDAEPSINGLLRHIVTSLGSAYVNDLERIILERYGIALDRNRIRERARKTNLYYASLIDRFYKNYDQFLSEVY